MKALQRTLEFEEELAEKFGGGSSKEMGSDIGETDRGENNSQTVSDIRKKYEKKLGTHEVSESQVCISDWFLYSIIICLENYSLQNC